MVRRTRGLEQAGRSHSWNSFEDLPTVPADRGPMRCAMCQSGVSWQPTRIWRTRCEASRSVPSVDSGESSRVLPGTPGPEGPWCSRPRVRSGIDASRSSNKTNITSSERRATWRLAKAERWLLDAVGTHGDTRPMMNLLQNRWNWWLPSQEWAAR